MTLPKLSQLFQNRKTESAAEMEAKITRLKLTNKSLNDLVNSAGLKIRRLEEQIKAYESGVAYIELQHKVNMFAEHSKLLELENQEYKKQLAVYEEFLKDYAAKQHN